MIYKIKYHKRVIKFLEKQNKSFIYEVVNFFDSLKNDPYNFGNYDVKKLKGFKDSYRLRITKYRIIFSIKDSELLIEVIKAGSRGDIYK